MTTLATTAVPDDSPGAPREAGGISLIELALTTYAESTAMEAEETDDRLERQRAEFIDAALACASRTLGTEAQDLNWLYVPTSSLPEGVEEARARLASGRLDYLRYRANYDNEERALDLVQPCLACGQDRVTAVTGLYHLGRALSETDGTHPAPGGEEAETDPAPLAGIRAAEASVVRAARLARRLVDEHPDAGLIVNFATIYGHQDGDGRAELRLLTSVEAAESVATSLGVDLTWTISSTIPSYVFRRGEATVIIDGVEVQLSAHTQLPEEQAAAWRAEQSPPAESAAHHAGT